MACRHCRKDQCLLTISYSTCFFPDENSCARGCGKGIIKYLKYLGSYDKCIKNPKYLDPFQLLEKGILKKGCRVKLSIEGFENFTEIEYATIMKSRPGETESDSVIVIINGKAFDTSWITEIEDLNN
jgi:hypothetical protein